MMFAELTPSPVETAFADIQNCPMDKLRLSQPETNLLRVTEDNPMEYTLAKQEDACAYVRILLRVLAEATGPSGPSSEVSHITEALEESEAKEFFYTDPIGVMTHYVISKLYEVIICLEDSSSSIEATFYRPDGSLLDEWRALLRVLHLGGVGDPFAQRGAALSLSCILVKGCQSSTLQKLKKGSSVMEPLNALISWIVSQLQSSNSASLSLITPSLLILMGCTEARTVFHNNGGIGYISRHLRVRHKQPRSSPRNKVKGASVQQVYELCFCLWTLTYELNDSAAVRSYFARDDAVAALVDLIAAAPREKVVRVALSALVNLAVCTSDMSSLDGIKKDIDGRVFMTDMIGCGLIKHIDLMKERQFKDPDIVQDLDTLYVLLHRNYREMTRFDVYKAEVASGHLQWGVLHTEEFFRRNAKKMEGSDCDFKIVRTLTKLLTSPDEEVVAIACFDIGEFVRHYPNGRAIAKLLGAKELIMPMIENENPGLRHQALLTVSKMLVKKNWAAVQFLN